VQEAFLDSLTPEELEFLRWDWDFFGRPDQHMPAGDWFVWLILSGRGWGKTRTAVECISEMLRGPTPMIAPPGAPAVMSIVADTPFDMRQYTIEGPSGFLNVGPPEWRPMHEPSKKTLTWPNGCKALLFSAEDPESTRGASGSFFWWDELAKSRYADEGWQNMLFGMREGTPRGIVTTTPRPKKIIKDLVKAPSTHVTVGSTWDNVENLSPVFYENVIKPLEGTRRGRQEIEAEILDDTPGALWTRAMIEAAHRPAPHQYDRIVVGVDPSGSDGETGDSQGIIVAGRYGDEARVIEDCTVRLGPDGWGRACVSAYHRHKADRIVAERNYGGEMVRAVIQSIDPDVPVTLVTATRGKHVRAEPIAALYEQGRVSHSRDLAQLEDQMCAMTTTEYTGEGSPDRLDAMVWAMTDLMIDAPKGVMVW
jgi:phage terminase large subunit-like protein